MLPEVPSPLAASGRGGALVLGSAMGAGAVLLAGRLGIAHQARTARRRIGKPLGEETPVIDGMYRKSLGRPLHLLILGDSIAAGLGAREPKRSLGGQLARRLGAATGRSVHLRSVAVVGAETPALAQQIASLPEGYGPDLAVIVVGGNDVIHRIRPQHSRDALAEAVDELRRRGAGVVVGTCPDLGALRAVPQPLRTFLSVLSRRLAALQQETALRHGAYAVRLADVVGPFFATQPDEMFSVDSFHPSEAGYRRTAKALLPSLMLALGERTLVPFGHHAPVLEHGPELA